MGKKNPLLFTIQFTAGLPMHEQAAAFLAKCGRHKASIIAEALNMYLTQDQSKVPLHMPEPVPLTVPAPRPVPDVVIKEVLEKPELEKTEKTDAQNNKTSDNVVEKAQEEAKKEVPEENVDTGFSADDLALICGSLDAFNDDGE